tara:strand:- start:255 stop:437 length:183 start_codon:yes stop_codon:yes gene_type:complete
MAVERDSDYREPWSEDKNQSIQKNKELDRRTHFKEAGVERFNDYYDEEDSDDGYIQQDFN